MNSTPLFKKIEPYWRLMRLDKPIGTLLLLWPTLWALWIASKGLPNIKNICIFVAGVVIMRSAGCVINDYADRNFDGKVTRTQNRPLATQIITKRSALILFFSLCLVAGILVLFTNFLTMLLAVFALMTAIIYPFMKRYTYWPQFILGVAFSFSIPMAFAAETGKLFFITWLLMITNILWTIAYDTQYAMVDRNDDKKIGIKSTAILFDQYDRFIIGLLQCLVIVFLNIMGLMLSFSYCYFIAIFGAFLLFLYQQYLIKEREPSRCFQAFLNNQWVGLLVFIGIVLGLM